MPTSDSSEILDNTARIRIALKIRLERVLFASMPGILKLIRKRIFRRRVVALWLSLVAIELFCPALCEIGANAATPSSHSSASVAMVVDESDGRTAAVTSCETDGDHETTGDCNDECLCHAVAIPSITGDIASAAIDRSPIMPTNNSPIFNSLPPPYIPPKFS